MNGRHGLAAILSVMTMRVALHRIAALHGLLGRSHANAIERIARESDGENYDQPSSCKPHDNQGRGPTLHKSNGLGVARNVVSGWSLAGDWR